MCDGRLQLIHTLYNGTFKIITSLPVDGTRACAVECNMFESLRACLDTLGPGPFSVEALLSAVASTVIELVAYII